MTLFGKCVPYGPVEKAQRHYVRPSEIQSSANRLFVVIKRKNTVRSGKNLNAAKVALLFSVYLFSCLTFLVCTWIILTLSIIRIFIF